jgi:hypothetical protein
LFTNAGGSSDSRDLYVYRILAGGVSKESDDDGVKYDRGTGNAAFDGNDLINGQTHMEWNGALRFRINGGIATTTTTSTTTTTTLGGSCSLVGDYYPCNIVTIEEVVNLINKWVDNKADISEVIDLIYAYKDSQ